MKDFLDLLIKAIVDRPEEVSVEEIKNQDLLTLRLSVAPEDMGKVIGKGGRIIKALRNLVRVRAVKEGKRVNLELVETGSP